METSNEKIPLTKEEYETQLKPLIEENQRLKFQILELGIELANAAHKRDTGDTLFYKTDG